MSWNNYIIISASGEFTEAKTQLHNKALMTTFKLYKDLKTTEPSVSTLSGADPGFQVRGGRT